jgi:tetratricopeptide (TPR) repeat protein
MLKESWDGKTYYIQAKIEINPDEVAQSIDKLRQDRLKTKDLEESRKKVNELLQEINKLKNQAPSEIVTPSTSNRYMKTVNKLRTIELVDKAHILLVQRKLKDEKAIELYSEAIDLDPDFVDPYYWRAGVYSNLGYANKDQALTFFKKAIKDYNKVVQLNPQNFFYAWAFSGRGDVYQKLNDKKLAIKDYSEAIRHDPKSARNYYRRSDSYESIGEYEKAFADITKAIELISNYPYYNSGESFYMDDRIRDRANIAFKAKKFTEAIADYTQLIHNMESTKKDYLFDRWWNSHGSLNLNDKELERLAKEDEQLDHFILSKDYLNRGHVYAAMRVREQALSDFSKSINLYENIPAYFTRGKIYLSEGKFDLAVNDYSKVLEKNAGIPVFKVTPEGLSMFSEAYYGRGYARLKLGHREEALEDMKAAAKLKSKPAQDYLTSQRISW